MDRCIHKRAIVAGALGQSVVVAHLAPIASVANMLLEIGAPTSANIRGINLAIARHSSLADGHHLIFL